MRRRNGQSVFCNVCVAELAKKASVKCDKCAATTEVQSHLQLLLSLPKNVCTACAVKDEKPFDFLPTPAATPAK